MSKHTPGPWEVGHTIQDDGGLAVLTTAGHDRIAKAWAGSIDTGGSAAANARLIAAAPNLRAWLKFSLEYFEMEAYSDATWAEATTKMRALLTEIDGDKE